MPSTVSAIRPSSTSARTSNGCECSSLWVPAAMALVSTSPKPSASSVFSKPWTSMVGLLRRQCISPRQFRGYDHAVKSGAALQAVEDCLAQIESRDGELRSEEHTSELQ